MSGGPPLVLDAATTREQALALCNKYPNVLLETSSQSLTNVRAMVERAHPDRTAPTTP